MPKAINHIFERDLRLDFASELKQKVADSPQNSYERILKAGADQARARQMAPISALIVKIVVAVARMPIRVRNVIFLKENFILCSIRVV